MTSGHRSCIDSTVLGRGGRELIRLQRRSSAVAPSLVERARGELLARDTGEHPGFRFGFLLGIEDSVHAPAARRLAGELHREVVAPVGAQRNAEFSLSFLKAAEGVPPAASEGPLFAGFHLDTHPDVTDDGGPELLRVLINLGRSPRTLRYVRADRFELAAAGLEVPRSSFQVVDPPPELDVGVVEIPAFAGGTITYLTFWASLVPHVGVERPAGHFLASFEATAR